MKVAVYGLTKGGSALAVALAKKMDWSAFVKYGDAENNRVTLLDRPIKQLIAEHFKRYDFLVFIMATGIVVRTIAPLIESKTTDPGVIVIDEKAKHVISLLSGHIGGANQFAKTIALAIGATPVITTATDLNDTIAFDVVAVKNDFIIANISALMHISQAMINRDVVALYSACRIKGKLPDNVAIVASGAELNRQYNVAVTEQRIDVACKSGYLLHLIPRSLVVGIGCRKGKTAAEIDVALNSVLDQYGIDARAIHHIATVDVKRDEAGLLAFCETNGYRLDVVERRRIAAIEKQFTTSSFVKKTIGVGAVAEPVAYLSSDRGERLVAKQRCGGISIAIYRMINIEMEIV